MKYYEVYKDGMPNWLYYFKEEDRLKFDFKVVKDYIKVSLPFKYELEFVAKNLLSKIGF